MKKTIKVSLGGWAFSIYEDAYERFEAYINSLKDRMGSNPDAEMILADIEERAAELFSELLDGKSEITIDMVEKVIETLGNPEEIGDSLDEQATPESKSNHSNKRLYRDGERSIAAGVCSGLGAYFNIDPVVFRILFFLLMFAKGLGLLLYVLLWIVIPRATTPKHRLEMKGDPINLSNIEKDIKREYEQVRKNLNKKEVRENIDRGISAFGRIAVAFLKFFSIFVRVIGIIIAIILVTVGSLALIAVIGTLFFGGVVLSSIEPSFTEFSISELLVSTFDIGSVAWVTIPLLIIIAIPLLSLIFLGIRIIFNFRLQSAFISSTAATVWVMAIITLAVTLVLQARSFTIRESITEKYVLPVNEKTSKLYVESGTLADSLYAAPKDSIKFDEYMVGLTSNGFTIYGKPRVSFGRSQGNDYEIIVEKKSRGGTKQGAIQNAANVYFPYTLKDSVLYLNRNFSLPRGQQWRIQEVNVTINLPRGKSVFISPSMLEILNQEQELCHCWPDELIGRTWVMRAERLVEY